MRRARSLAAPCRSCRAVVCPAACTSATAAVCLSCFLLSGLSQGPILDHRSNHHFAMCRKYSTCACTAPRGGYVFPNRAPANVQRLLPAPLVLRDHHHNLCDGRMTASGRGAGCRRVRQWWLCQLWRLSASLCTLFVGSALVPSMHPRGIVHHKLWGAGSEHMVRRSQHGLFSLPLPKRVQEGWYHALTAASALAGRAPKPCCPGRAHSGFA